MGCSSANIIEENKNNNNNNISNNLNNKNQKKKDIYKIKRKGRPGDDESVIELTEKRRTGTSCKRRNRNIKSI